MLNNTTIVALATAQGVGAIAVLRLSGSAAIAIANTCFKGKDLTQQASHTISYGYMVDGDKVLDEVLVSIFKAPKSFTTEDVVEISSHGSPFIAEQILQLLLKNGAVLAQPGEFTLRAFMHGRIDLSQAEAVADMIASNSQASLDLAIKQMRGGFSAQIKTLRGELVNFAALIELELDFGEEDVEFANRGQLLLLIEKIQGLLVPLIESFKLGNVIKQGVNTVIAGKPNAGKSTLLNALLNEQRAIVSAIAGTTRDTIEEVLNIQGIQFRFIDTAGLRVATDEIEKIGVEKAMEKLKESAVYIYLFDVNTTAPQALLQDLKDLNLTGIQGIVAGNKIDQADWKKTAPFYTLFENNKELTQNAQLLFISADTQYNIDLLKQKLYAIVTASLSPDATVVTNQRHYQALLNAHKALHEVKAGIENGNTTDLVALDIKRSVTYLGEISGEVTNEEILGTIFSKFCIGK